MAAKVTPEERQDWQVKRHENSSQFVGDIVQSVKDI
jgi:hypothetical protein